MKVVFFTDLHLSGQTPPHRIDDYQSALLNKLGEVYESAKSMNADFVLCAGDFFNSHLLLNYNLLNSAMNIVHDSGIPTFSVVGQHDVYGYNESTFSKSVLSFMVNWCKNFNIIWEPVVIGNVVLYPSHVWDNLEDITEFDFNKDKCNIIVAHHLITNKKMPYKVHNTAELANHITQNCDSDVVNMVLSGDLHDGFEVHEEEGIWFCNPGSIARRAIDEQNRKPCYAVIDTDDCYITLRYVACASPGHEVFSESAAEVMREQSYDDSSFVAEVEAFENESADIREVIQKSARSQGLRQPVIEYLDEKSSESTCKQ